MTTRYQKSQIEDVALIFATRGMPDIVRTQLTGDFADLFAADNLGRCTHCIRLEGTTAHCDSADGHLRDEHNFQGGFDREQFLIACGLESEG